ncbi:MAG: SoxR reducing system RseC family protein [Desulfatiglandales bacterium]
MVKEIGLVKEIKGDNALVLVDQGKRCETCDAKGSCSLGARGSFELEVRVVPGLMEGQVVELIIPSGDLLKLSFLVYFVPILSFVSATTLAYYLLPENWDTGLLSLLVGLVCLFLTYIPLRRLDRRARATQRFTPQISRIHQRGLALRCER